MHEINYDKKTGKVEFNLDIKIEKNNNSGNIYSNFTEHLKNKRITHIKIGFNPRRIIKKNKIPNKYNYKQKISTNNKNNHDEINFGEEKIIIDIWNNSIEKVKKDKLKSKKYSNNKIYLFELESLITERVINIEIELNINESNINKIEEENYNYNDENITKEEHLFIADLNGEEYDNNKVNYKVYSTFKKPYSYIYNSLLCDQIISRQLKFNVFFININIILFFNFINITFIYI